MMLMKRSISMWNLLWRGSRFQINIEQKSQGRVSTFSTVFTVFSISGVIVTVSTSSLFLDVKVALP